MVVVQSGQFARFPLLSREGIVLILSFFLETELLEEARDMKLSSDARATQLQNELDTAQFKCKKMTEESEVLRGHIQVKIFL